MGIINNKYLPFCWVNWYFYHLTLDDYIKYYATNVLQIKKSKIDVCELVAINDYTGSSEQNVIKQANLLEPSNIEVDNINKQFFEMGLETDATIKDLATLTIYNWQLIDKTNSLIFL